MFTRTRKAVTGYYPVINKDMTSFDETEWREVLLHMERGVYKSYVDAVEAEVKRIIKTDLSFKTDYDKLEQKGFLDDGYAYSIYDFVKEDGTSDTALQILLSKGSYKNNDIYTALFYALEGLQRLRYLLTEIREERVSIHVGGDYVEITDMLRFKEIKETLPRECYSGNIGDMGDEFDADPVQIRKYLEVMNKLTYDVVFAYCEKLILLFSTIESINLDSNVTSRHIQELWSERYGSKNL